MGDSLQHYFSTILCGAGIDRTELVDDNARTPPPSRQSSSNKEFRIGWLIDCCAIDTTSSVACVSSGFDAPLLFSRWESQPQNTKDHRTTNSGTPNKKRDRSVRLPVRRSRFSNDSDNDDDEEDPGAKRFQENDGECIGKT